MSTTPPRELAALDLDHVEAAAAADTATPDGGRWVTQRDVAHLMSEAGRADPTTGAPLWRPLTATLRDLRTALYAPTRDAPSDEVQRLASFAAGPLADIVAAPRSRHVRLHEVVPLHRLREMDAKSMAWVSRLPGRTAREKLAMRRRGLAVLREQTVDSPENRLARWVLEAVAGHAERRLQSVAPLDGASDNNYPNRGALAGLVALKSRGLRRSPLGTVPPRSGVRPNNALLGDPAYSKVLRTWRRLRDLDELLLRGHRRLDEHAHAVLFWGIIAELVERGGVVQERLCRVSPDGWEVANGAGDLSCTVLLSTGGRPPQPLLVHLGDGVLTARALGSGPSGAALLSVPITLDAHEAFGPRRGVRLSAVQTTSAGFSLSIDQAADVEGLALIVAALAGRLADAPGERPAPLCDLGAVGVDPIHGQFNIHVEDGSHSVAAAPFALQLRDGNGEPHWVAGRRGSVPNLRADERVVPVRALERARIDHDAGTVRAEAALAAQTALRALAEDLPGLRNAKVALTVPDTLGTAGLRALRAGAASAFRYTLPVWRSVAAAVGWQQTWTTKTRAREGDVLMIVDPRDAFLSVTVLVARIDPHLAEADPTSRGVVWERRPPLVPGEIAQSLAMDHLFADCLEDLALESTGGPSRDTHVLVQTGQADDLVFGDGSILVPRRESWHRVAVDRERSRKALARWQHTLGTAAKAWSGSGALSDTLHRLKSRHSKSALHVLLVGHPFRDLPDRNAVRSALRKIAGPYSPPEAVEWLDPATHVVARGAQALAQRSRDGLATWTEWVPSLHLLTVQDDRYDPVRLLKSRSVRPLLGERVRHRLDHTLTLHPGPSVYRIPVLAGEHGEDPTENVVVLRSPAFPLQEPRDVSLTFTYQVGSTDDHLVEVRPADHQSLAVTARWEDLRDRPSPDASPWTRGIDLGETPPVPSDIADQIAEITSGLDQVCRTAPRNADKMPWWRINKPIDALLGLLQGRTPSETSQIAGLLVDTNALTWLRRVAGEADTPNDSESWVSDPEPTTRARAVGALLGLGLASERLEMDVIAELRTLRTTPPSGRLSAANAVYALEASGALRHLTHLWATSRTPLLYYTNRSVYNRVAGSLAVVGLRQPGILRQLASTEPGGDRHLVQFAEFALERLIQSIPNAKVDDSKGRQLVSPFENACRLLVAATAMRDLNPEVLQAGGERSRYLATLVSVIDGMVQREGWKVRYGVPIPDTAQSPPHLPHLSKLAAVTVSFLLGEPPVLTVSASR